jgi:hypothetical protein
MKGQVVGLAKLRITVICLVVLAVVSSGLLAPVSGAGGSNRAANGRTADNDNSFATANTAINASVVNGSLNSTDDVYDYFKIDVLSGQTISAMMTFTCSTSNLAVQIYDPSQQYITGGASGFPMRGDVYIAIINGTYYVAVLIQARPAEDNYTLNITVDYPPIIKTGDVINAAVNGSSYNRISWYRTWLDGNVSGRSEAVFINMTEGSGVTNYNLAIVGILNAWDMAFYNSSNTHSPSESASAAASYTGWYNVVVYGQPGSGAGTVTFTVQKFMVNSDGDNDYKNGTKAKHNAVVNGHVDQGWDHYDWYKYHVFAGDMLRVRVDRTTGGDLLYLGVFLDDLSLVDGNINYDSISGQVTTFVSLDIPSAAAETTYLVHVEAYSAFRSGAQSDETAAFDYKLTFSSTNRRPEVLSSLPDITIDEDKGYSFNLSSHYNDVDQDTVHFNFSGLNNVVATYTEANGTIELSPKANWYGKETLTVLADDYFGGTVTLTSNITVNSVNDLPFVKKSIPDVKMLQGGTDTTIDLSKVFTDADTIWGDRFEYEVTGNGSVMVDIQPNGAVRLTAPVTYFGSLTMTFFATDNASAMASTICNVSVAHVNQPPHISVRPVNISVNEDETATLDLSKAFTDPEGDPITINPSQMTRMQVNVDPNTLVATFKPAKDMSGFFEDIKFTAQDDQGAEGDYVVVRVTVTVVNDLPVFKTLGPAGDVSLMELEGQEFSGSATDVDNAVVNYTWYLDGKDLRISETTYAYTTGYESAGNHTVKLVVDDGDKEITKIWNVTVLNKNRDPSEVKIISPKTGENFPQGSEIEFEGSARDLDKDALTYRWVDGKTEISTEKSFKISDLRSGNHNIYLEASDGITEIRSKNIIITVDANKPPAILGYTPAIGQKFTTGQKIGFSVNVKNDEAGDILSYRWTDGSTVLSTAQSFETSDLKAGLHNVLLSVYDGFSYTCATVSVEVERPAAVAATNMRTLGIMGGVVAAVAVLGAIAFIMMRRRRPSATAPGGQTAGLVQSPPGAATQPAPGSFQPTPPGYQQPPGPPPYDFGGGYQQPPADGPQQYDSGAYQPPAPGEPGVPPSEAYQQQPAWAMAPPSQPGGGDAVRPAEPVTETQPVAESRPPTEPQEPQA